MRRLAIAILMSVPLFAGGVFAQQKAGKDNVYEELNLFDQAFERIREDAVDPVTDAKLIGAAIAGMLSGLDPHSSFIDEAAFKASQTPANDDAASLGMAVTIDSGQLKVISPQDGSPAAQVGIRPGDVIFSIGQMLNPANNVVYNVAVQTPQYRVDSIDALMSTPVSAANGSAPTC